MKTIPMPEIDLGVILYEECGLWIAQGVEYDITARGTDMKDAMKRFSAKLGAEVVMSIEIGDDKLLGGVCPAPKRFWDMYEVGQPVPTDRVPIRILDGTATPRVLPHARVIEAAAA